MLVSLSSSLVCGLTFVPESHVTFFPFFSFLRYNLDTIEFLLLKCKDPWFLVYSHNCTHVQSVQSHLTRCDLMDCSTPGLPVHHQLPELTQTHVHQVSDAIQPSHPLSSPSSPTFNLSQHQGIFK